MHKVYLGIGGNIGNKSENFKKVLVFIEKKIGHILENSSVYETPPWGFQSEHDFWNQVLLIETKFEALEILWRIKEIEDQFDRKESAERYTSRQMDVDILYFDEQFIETNNLIIPHPRIHQRKFVLVPLVEIAPDLKHPLLRLTSLQMLENCKDESLIKKLSDTELYQ